MIMDTKESSTPWNPWRALVEDFRDVELILDYELPERVWGLAKGRRIWICKTLDTVRRTSTLAHELIHQERGIVICKYGTPAKDAGEEAVREMTARRLIPDALLAKTLAANPKGTFAGWSAEMGVCRPDLRDRIAFLTKNESGELQRRTGFCRDALLTILTMERETRTPLTASSESRQLKLVR